MPKDQKMPSTLPAWDLDDLYPGKQSSEFKSALKEIDESSRLFSKKYKGRISQMSADNLTGAIKEFEEIVEKMGRVGSYISLKKSVDASESAWAQTIQEQLKPASKKLIFLTLEINKIEDDAFNKMVSSSKDLTKYKPWLDEVRSGREHELPEDIEQFISDKSMTGAAAWARLHSETRLDLRFKINGKEYTETEALGLTTDPDSSIRRKAYQEIGRVFGENEKLFALITNTLAKDKEINDKWRNYETKEASRHKANQIEPEVVEALSDAVKDAYPRLSHKYYAWKAKKFGVKKLHPADRNAAVFKGKTERKTPWEEAKNLVLEAYGDFSKELADIGKGFFDGNWIDVPPREGKRGGAFAAPTVPSVHPYLMLNYQGKSRDVMTLAHELGHGCHQVLEKKDYLLFGTPLTLAETASVFGEMLTFRKMLDSEQDLEARRAMLSNKVEDMMNTVVRQIAFYTFEQEVHEERRTKGELSSKRIGEIWTKTQKEALGPSVNLDVKGAENFWMYVPHFINTPFYVYAYAFGDCLVNALYDEYEKSSDKPEFADKYLDLLRAGGTKKHKELLAPFGLDASDPAFWQKGLSVIEGYMDELFELDEKLELRLNKKSEFNKSANKKPVSKDIKPPKPPAPKKPGL